MSSGAELRAGLRRRPRSNRRGAVLAVVLALGVPTTARADLAGHFGLNARTMGMAGAFTGVADDVSALYYNPGGLTQLEGLSLASGFLVGAPALDEDGRSVGMPTETSTYIHVGVPLAGRLKDYVALAVALNMPLTVQLQGKLYGKDEPYFLLYDAAVRMMQLRVGGAVRVPWEPLSFLSIGAAAQLYGSSVTPITVVAPVQRSVGGEPSDPDARLEGKFDFKVPLAASFSIGALAEIGDSWRIGLSYRSAQSIHIEVPVTLRARIVTSPTDAIELPVRAKLLFDTKHTPQQVTIGGSYRRDELLVSLDVSWIDYSSFVIPFPRVAIDLDTLRKAPGLGLLLGPNPVLLAPHVPEVRFVDVWVPRVAAAYRLLEWLTVSAGYAYEYSPLRTTDLPIFDNDKHTVSLGARASFLRPGGIIPGRLSLDLSLQELIYVVRSIHASDVGGHVFACFAGVKIVLL